MDLRSLLKKLKDTAYQGIQNVRGNVQAIANPQTRSTWMQGFTPTIQQAAQTYQKVAPYVPLAPQIPQPQQIQQNRQAVMNNPIVKNVVNPYIQNRVVGFTKQGIGQLSQIPQNLSQGQYLNAGKNLALGTFNTTAGLSNVVNPAFGLAWAGYDALKAQSASRIRGGSIPQSLEEMKKGFTGEKQVGLGTSMTTNPTLETAGNVAEIVLPLAHLAVGTVKNIKNALRAAKVSPQERIALQEAPLYLGENAQKELLSQKGIFEVGKISNGKWVSYRTYDSSLQAKKAMKMIPLEKGEQLGLRDITPTGLTEAQATMKIPQKERGFVTSVQKATTVTDPTKTNVTGTYTPKPNVKLMGEAEALLNEGVSIKFNQVEGLDKKVAATIQEAINMDKAGNPQAAANLYNNLSEKGTELGRSVQAFSMIDKMSPEAISLSAAGKIKAYNRTATRKIPELTGEQVKMIANKVSQIDSLTGRAKNIAINELQEVINNFIPSSLADKAITVWKAGLLTSLRTHERNLLGNTIMGTSEFGKDIPASVADTIMSLRTGKRTLTLTGQGSVSGAKKGVQAFKDVVTKGFDPEETISKYDVKRVTWGNNPVEQVLKKYTDVVFRTLSGADKPFWNSSFARSLYDQAGAEAINAGQQGNRAFIQKLVDSPTEEMLKTALKDANYATFKDKNVLSNVASALKRTLNQTELGKLGGNILMPFTGVPSSIVEKTIAYSPVGLIKGIVKAGNVVVNNIPELQRQASQELGRGVMGTSLFALGAYLMKNGLMTGQPKDAKEADLWATQGKQANSVLIGGKWRSINSIGPQNLIVLAGAKYQEEVGNSEGSLGNYAFGLGKDQLSQTFLSGVQQPLNALTDPARYGKSYIGNQVASVIPNIVKDTSKALDPNVRETNKVTDYLKSGTPILRNTLIPKRDVLGNTIPQEPTGINAFFDLFNSKTPIDNATVQELTRLYNTGNEALPSKMTVNQTILKQKAKLTFEQLNNLEAGVGEALKPQLEALIMSPTYQRLEDEKKAKAIDKLVQDVRLKYKNINATDILSGPSATGFPQVNTTASLKSQIQTQGKTYSYVDEEGNYKTIDLSPIKKPTLTGNTELDKKLVSSYTSKLSSNATDIVKLYQAGQLTAEEADKMLTEINDQKASVAKPKTIKIKKTSMPKIKIASPKSVKIKLSKFKVSKPKKTKKSLFKIKKTPKLKSFKIL